MFYDLQPLVLYELITINEAKEVAGGGSADVDRFVSLAHPVDRKIQDDPWPRRGGYMNRFCSLSVINQPLVGIVCNRLNTG